MFKRPETIEGAHFGTTWACLASWRPCKGIYILDDTVLDALLSTPVSGPVPVEILRKLPEWCVYVVLPKGFDRYPLAGFFAFIMPVAYWGTMLVIGLVSKKITEVDSMRFIGFPLIEGETISRCVDLLTNKLKDLGHDSMRPPDELTYPLVSVILYLCSTNAEIRGRDAQLKPLARPPLHHTKRGPRTFGPDQPRIWEVAYRIGAALRAAAPGMSGPDRHGRHASPRPHIRRAHWHAFWTGEKAKLGTQQPTKRELILHWLPPIPVKVTPETPIIPTVHQVVEDK